MKSDVKRTTALAVELNGKHVGVINRMHGDKTVFSFIDDYLDDAKRPVLSLSFKGSSGNILPPKITQSRIHPFFANLLPEGHLRTYLADRAGVNAKQEFFLLAALGNDLPGAVEVRPIDEPSHAAHVSLDESSVRKPKPGGGPLRFSLAGVQLKFSAVLEAAGGLTIPADGIGGSWIVKLPSQQHQQVPENEFAIMSLARAIGFEIPEIKLVPIEEIHGLPDGLAPQSLLARPHMALAVRRFDRDDSGGKIHMEDFAQVFSVYPDDKYGMRSYANIASVLLAEAGLDGALEFVKRVAFSILVGNGDMHLKNWSLLYKDGAPAALSPAYDLLSTIPYIPNDRLGLSFGKSRSLEGIGRDQARRFADTAGMPQKAVMDAIIEVVECTKPAWDALTEKENLARPIQEAIESQITRAATNSLL